MIKTLNCPNCGKHVKFSEPIEAAIQNIMFTVKNHGTIILDQQIRELVLIVQRTEPTK